MISIETIIGSAQRINKQRSNVSKTDKDGLSSNSADKVQISARVNSRLDAIESDMKGVQTSITESQIARSILTEMREESLSSNPDYQRILEKYDADKQSVLDRFLDMNTVDKKSIDSALTQTEKNISSNISKLKKIQIETENIFASNLADDAKAASSIKSIETYFVSSDFGAMNKLSSLNADVVMRLTK